MTNNKNYKWTYIGIAHRVTDEVDVLTDDQSKELNELNISTPHFDSKNEMLEFIFNKFKKDMEVNND